MRSLDTAANDSLSPAKPTEKLHKAEVVQSSFPLEMEPPGGWHDNDLADISKIKLLPTYGEIVDLSHVDANARLSVMHQFCTTLFLRRAHYVSVYYSVETIV
jgi:hypothetical protein